MSEVAVAQPSMRTLTPARSDPRRVVSPRTCSPPAGRPSHKKRREGDSMQRSFARLVISYAMGARSGSGALGELVETLQTTSSSSGVREILEALQGGSSSGALRDLVAEGLKAVAP